MTLLFNAESNITDSKEKLIKEIVKSDNAGMLQELYWLIKEQNEEDKAAEEDEEGTRLILKSA